ncbi:MAG: cupin domain-containing protein [Patescibacteria group bacterium]|jgi:mannose-6-phosphate isomerase-like protein (cupin superfamily)
MNGYVGNIEQETLANENFRNVLYTASHGQLVVMSLLPSEEIGDEVHTVDQFFRVDAGQGKIIIDGEESVLSNGMAAIVPAGSKHNVINTSATEPMKLYTLYMPPQHKDGTVHATKADAMADEEDHL